MVKLVVTADNHLSRYYAKMTVPRLEERRRTLRRAFRRAVDYAVARRADFFLQAGDLFDTVDPRNAERQFVADCLAELRDAGVVALAVGGNHDTPRQTTEHGGYSAAGVYDRLGGLRLFSRPDAIEYALFERAGQRIAIGGLSWDPLRGYGEDPLDGLQFEDPPDGRPEWKLLLLHGSLEGHVFPGAAEPIFRRESLARVDADCFLIGHVHARTHFAIEGRHVIVPGATERMVHDEFPHDPGFVVVELHRGHELRHTWVTHPAQPRARVHVSAAELIPEPRGLRPAGETAAQVLLRRVEEASHLESITVLALGGPPDQPDSLPREVYVELDLPVVQERGGELNFCFEIDTSGLRLEDEFGQTATRGLRLSQVEEIEAAVAALRAEAQTERDLEVLARARGLILAYYDQP